MCRYVLKSVYVCLYAYTSEYILEYLKVWLSADSHAGEIHFALFSAVQASGFGQEKGRLVSLTYI